MLAGRYGFDSGTRKKFSLGSEVNSGCGIHHQILQVGLSEVTYQEEMLLDGGAYHSLLLVPKLRIYGALPPLLH
jgi:hypothetical protein